MLTKIKVYLLDTPEKHWLIVRGYHVHKSFWGVLLLVIGTSLVNNGMYYLGVGSLLVGLFWIIIDILGHKKTKHRPYFQILEKSDTYKVNEN